MTHETPTIDSGPKQLLRTWRELFAIAWPIALSGLVTLTISSNDAVLLGSASASVLASVVASSSLQSILAMSVAGLVSSAQILIARAAGAGRRDHAARASSTAIWAGVWIGTAAAVVVAAAGPPVLSLLGGAAIDPVFASRYLQITLLALPFVGLTSALRARVSGLGATRGLFAASAASAAVDILASLTLNALIGPFGVALGTLIGTVSGAAVFLWLVRRSTSAEIPPPQLRMLLVVSPRALRSLLALGWPEAVFFAASAGAGLVVTWLLSPFSPTLLSAARFLEIASVMVVFTILSSVGAAATTLLGRAAGAADADQWKHVWRSTTAFTLGIGALAILLGPFALPPLLRQITQPQIAAAAQTVVWLAFAQALIMAVQVAMTAGLRSLKDTRGPMAAAIIAEYAVFLPLGWLLTRHYELGLTGVFITHLAYWASALLVCAVRLLPRWRRLSTGASA